MMESKSMGLPGSFHTMRYRRLSFNPEVTARGKVGVVTLSEIGPIWTINQQAKCLKSLASTLAVVGKFRSVGLNVTTPLTFVGSRLRVLLLPFDLRVKCLLILQWR
jgi:hypothetical protein